MVGSQTRRRISFSSWSSEKMAKAMSSEVKIFRAIRASWKMPPRFALVAEGQAPEVGRVVLDQLLRLQAVRHYRTSVVIPHGSL